LPRIDEALARIYGRIPLGMRLGLDAMRGACAGAGHPERTFPVVHVAGTNGKGSVCAMVEAIARAEGLATGLYTSPHLCRFAERIRLNGAPVDDTALASWLTRALDTAPELSFFETATLAAFLAFRDARVDLAVIEVGIGGRLDATNVVPLPRAAAITRIALDHTDRLGPTLVDIAREKAGIAKPGLDVVLGPMSPEVRAAIDEVAHAHGATTFPIEASSSSRPQPSRIGLAGEHQRDNARIAAELGARIGAAPTSVAHGIADVSWPGRLERIGDWLLDGAHNPDSADALARYVRSLALPPEHVALVFGTLGDKEWAPMLDTLAPLAATRVYTAPAGASRSAVDPRAMAARHSGALASSMDDALAIARPFEAGATPSRAVDLGVISGPGIALAIVAGSLVLVGEARALLLGLPRDPPVAL
jgi:dihydrofolate synthase/folylpolyglutamate synthase